MIKAALRNPIAVLMLSIGLLLLGGIAIKRLPVDLFPNLSVPVVIVGTSFRGAPPEVVEQSVTLPIEQAVAQAWNIDSVTSSTRQGLSVVYAWFHWGSDIDAALLDVQQQVQAIGDTLPEHARAPMIVKFDLSSLPVAFVTVRGDASDERELFELAHYVLAPQLAAVPGVSAATASGGRWRQMNVDLDPNKLRETGLSLLDVHSAIRRANVLIPSGTMQSGRMEYDIIANTQMTSKEELEDLVIKMVQAAPGARAQSKIAVRIKDVGEVRDTHRQQSQIVHVDGDRAVYLKIYKQPGANTIATVEALREHLAKLHGVPPHVRLETTFEQSTYIENAIRSLQIDALLGVSIVVVVLLIFLASFTSTIIVAISLPLAFLATLVVLFLTGETINVFTLGGLALAIGRLVDNAIIVLEAIHRHQHAGKNPLQAALDGAREVASPVLAGTLTTIIVFIPLWFLGGISKYLFTPMGLTISAAMVASYIISLTVIPVLSRRFGVRGEIPPRGPSPLRRVAEAIFAAIDGVLGRFEAAYARSLRRSLRRKALVLGAAALLFIGSLGLARTLGADFFPPIDEGEFSVKARASIGTRLEETEALAVRLEEMVREEVPPEMLVGTNTSIGSPKGGLRAVLSANSGPHALKIRVELVPPGERERTLESIIQRLRERAAEEFPGISVTFDPRGTIREIINFGHKAPIVVEVRGYDLPTGSALAAEVAAAMKGIPGLVDVKSIRQDDYPNFRVDVDRERAGFFGIHQEDVARIILGSVFGDMSRAPFMIDPESGLPYEIITRLAAPYRDEVSDLEEISLQHKGQPILLKAIATIRRSVGPLELERRDLQRIAEITANVEPGRSISGVAEEIDRRLATIEVPSGFAVDVVGQAKEQAATNRDLAGALALAMCFVYMTMAIQLRSLLHPMIIMITVPLGLIGVFAAMALTGTTFSATSVMGMIMMVGIVVANGILLVDSANAHLREGGTPEEAAIAASKLRLRPILMTSLTLELGLIPMAIGGPGGELYAPLARTVMGGLLASTFLTLYVVPALYTLVERRWPTNTSKQRADDAILDADA